MTIELEHFFIRVRPAAPEADILAAMGLVEGTPNVHPGQGTANRRFFKDLRPQLPLIIRW